MGLPLLICLPLDLACTEEIKNRKTKNDHLAKKCRAVTQQIHVTDETVTSLFEDCFALNCTLISLNVEGAH